MLNMFRNSTLHRRSLEGLMRFTPIVRVLFLIAPTLFTTKTNFSMLGIHSSSSQQAAIEYLTAGLSVEGYYMKGEIRGAVWRGQIAQMLGIEGQPVTKEAFSCLVNRIDPVTKQMLGVKNVEHARAGFDMTYSVVKSISVLHAITKDPAILEALEAGIAAAQYHVERDAQTQANTRDQRFYETTSSLIYANFFHKTSRPYKVDKDGITQYQADPAYHYHSYLMSTTFSRKNNRFQALEIGNIHRLAPFYQEIFHSTVAYHLHKSGYPVRQTKDRFEIAGVSRAVIEKFSNRTAIIEEEARRRKISDPRAKSELAVKTRLSKTKALSETELEEIWQQRLTPQERNDLHTLKNKSFDLPPL